MITYNLYRRLLRLPSFKGKSRLENLLRNHLKPKATRVQPGFDMYLDPLEWTQVTLLSGRTTEPATIELYGRLLKSNDVYVDVGAHVGFHALVARRLIGGQGRVVAIEPQPYNCDRILSNWQLNGYENLELYVAVAGPLTTTVRLHNQTASDKARLSLTLNAPNDLPQVFCVPMLRLDAVIPPASNVPKVKLLKIDAEGYEAEVLSGLGLACSRVDNIIIEVLTESEIQRKRSEEAVHLLRGWGFRLYDVRGTPYGGGMALIESNLWATRNAI